MDMTGDESPVDDGEPCTPPVQSAAFDPGATPTQKKPGEAWLEETLTKRMLTLEEKIIQANNDAMQKMAESNTRLLTEFKTIQTEAMEKSIQTAVVSGLSGLNQNVGRLTESLETISKTQSITSQLLSRLEARLDGERSHSQARSSSHFRSMSTNAGHADDTQAEGSNQSPASAKGKERMEVDDDDDYEDYEEAEYADGEDQVEEGNTLKKKWKATKTKRALELQENIRHWLNDLIGGQQYALTVAVTDEEAKKFEEIFAQDPLAKLCTVHDFWYYINGKPSATWNKGAAFVFVDYVK
ncbi:hypothetical protein LENED_006241 [Lentinula edodes]|uniref:Uncharacterized protein n=1 Tax=Lentinula edodes TaxID=5353 RepID=A0A1Q3EB84_LENED|nr:hypothetical protein LENED_006241 [Lentinula edodes]